MLQECLKAPQAEGCPWDGWPQWLPQRLWQHLGPEQRKRSDSQLGSLVKDMKISPWRRFMSSFCPSRNLWSLTFSWLHLSETRFRRLSLYKSRPVLASRTGSRHLSPMGSQPRVGVKCSREAASAIHGAIILTKLSIIVQWGYWRNEQDQQARYCFLQGDWLLWFCTGAPHTCCQEHWYHLCPKSCCWWLVLSYTSAGLPRWYSGKESTCQAEDLGSIPGWGRSPGEENGNPLHYSFLENPMDGGAWWATGNGVAKSQMWLSDFTHILI